MNRDEPSYITDVLNEIIQVAQWYRGAKELAKTKTEKDKLNVEIKKLQRQIINNIKTMIDIIDDKKEELDSEKKKLQRLKTIVSSDIERADEHILKILYKQNSHHDDYSFYNMRHIRKR